MIQDASGKYRIKGVGSGDVSLPFGHVRRDLGYCVKAAVEAQPDLNLLAVGDMMSWNQYLKTWCESQGVQFGEYDEYSLEKFMEILPGMGRTFGKSVLFAMEFGYGGKADPTVIRPNNVSSSFELYSRA
jgi:hypothetical protein